jgi:SAM-dependent methyltransferase
MRKTDSQNPPAARHGDEEASAWVRRWSHLLPAHAKVLDLACGRGRHSRWFHALGHRILALDRSPEALAAIGLPADRCETLLADIEGDPWPLAGRQFDAVVVTNYLWRPLLPELLDTIAPGGVLIYETFAAGNETVGKPSRPDFLLQPGELLRVCRDLRTVAFEDGFEGGLERELKGPLEATSEANTSAAAPGGGRFVQRIAAVKELQARSGPDPDTRRPARYKLG